MKTTDREQSMLRQLLRMRTTSPVLFFTFVLLLIAEFAAAVVGPLVIPDQMYLRAYLSKAAIKSAETFSKNGHMTIVYDEKTGWRSRPNVTKGNWHTDSHGARTTHNITENGARERYVIFLGSSLVNGGTEVSNDQTLSAYIEDDDTESINFASMLYSLDQTYIAYKDQLRDYNGDVLVVGISDDPTASLLNRYVPFQYRDESSMPFFKPRFTRTSNGLKLIGVPTLEAYSGMLDSPDLMSELKSTDDHYRRFNAFKRFQFTPMAGGLYYIYSRCNNLLRWVFLDFEGIDIMTDLMGMIVSEADSRGTDVIFVLLPKADSTTTDGWRSRLPDRYGFLLETIEGAGFRVLDARMAIRDSGMPLWKIYIGDNKHFTSEGNRVIAKELKAMIDAVEPLRQPAMKKSIMSESEATLILHGPTGD